MKRENLILTLAAIAACLLFWLLLSSCSHLNLIIDNNLQVKASGQKHIGHLGGWMEGDTAIVGTAVTEMSRDSVYVMNAEGWNMRIKYDRITWDFQVPRKPHFPEPGPVPVEAKQLPYADVVIGFTKRRDIDYGF